MRNGMIVSVLQGIRVGSLAVWCNGAGISPQNYIFMHLVQEDVEEGKDTVDN